MYGNGTSITDRRYRIIKETPWSECGADLITDSHRSLAEFIRDQKTSVPQSIPDQPDQPYIPDVHLGKRIGVLELLA